MADSQAGEGRSLTLRLSAAICLAVVALALAAGWVSYVRARTEANSLQDDVLRQVAALAVSGHVTTGDLGVAGLDDSASEVQVTSAASAGVLAGAPDGFTTTSVSGMTRRVLVTTRADGSRIAVSQSEQVRDEIAHDTALASIAPLIALLPLMLVSVPLIIRTTMRPVHVLADELGARAPDDLRPLPAIEVPREFGGFVAALNGQLGRAAEVIESERRFIGEAAHELRTPLTAISLQLDRARSAGDLTESRERLDVLATGVARARHQVTQLLDLARAQAATPPGPADTPFADVLLDVLADASALAAEHDIDLTVDRGADVRDLVSRMPVTLILRNVLDNAIRYADTHVTVSAASASGRLSVVIEDDGPGIADPVRVLQPFHRGGTSDVDGTGLGLTIVAGELTRLGGSLTIDSPVTNTTGTRATASWPVDG